MQQTEGINYLPCARRVEVEQSLCGTPCGTPSVLFCAASVHTAKFNRFHERVNVYKKYKVGVFYV